MKKIFTTLLLVVFSWCAFAQQAPFQLIELPYATNELEPVISQSTVELHHGKHLQGYVNNLNRLVKGTIYEKIDLREIVANSKQGGIFNNAGQTLNHNLYFLQFSPKGGGEPSGALAKAIQRQWKTFDQFKAEFSKRASGLFGSGWLWLSKDDKGHLVISEEANGGNPVSHGLTPILGFDLWEHAYYLDYQNRRADHVNQLWNIINWEVVEKRYE